ncbi:glycosyltransferase family 4 protein [Planococcus sp. 1R117A]|uniref:glycosyltransferase family 4 protein n=1 Tax=Planococcus sp. 1R117A TaxID=3447020 RepID=UPI003EDC0AFE
MGSKVIQAVTVSESLYFMKGQLKYLAKCGYDIKAMSSNGSYVAKFEKQEETRVLLIEMEREISLLKDFKSLVKCIRIIRKEKPDIVNASTPKAGLIVTLAAYICRVPIRIYTLRGLRMETTSGLKRQILVAAEKVAAGASTHCLAVSDSLKSRIAEFGIAPIEKISVLGKGSGDGFNIAEFQKTAEVEETIKANRKKYGLTEEHVVLGFVGRMTKDKGITELIDSFLALHKTHPNLRLLLIGDYEMADPVEERIQKEIKENPYIIHTGYQGNPVPFYHMMDVFVFLTKREGFGNVAIEAALSKVPVIAANVTGAKNTIVDGKTGFLADPENPLDILEKLELLILAPEIRRQMGEQGYNWAIENFSNQVMWKELDRYYQTCLADSLKPAGQTHI